MRLLKGNVSHVESPCEQRRYDQENTRDQRIARIIRRWGT